MYKYITSVLITMVSISAIEASVVIDTVLVGNPGNTGEWSGPAAGGVGEHRRCGAVDYYYDIGKYEVTASQYAEFLNAVASTDPYELYDSRMRSYQPMGCQIIRSGRSGSYAYSVSSGWENKPVNFVSWGDAARFANWMHNGQGCGDTETGSYSLNGAMTEDELLWITREEGATWAITSEDEWYKAAYHKNDGATGNYFDYPTQSDEMLTSMANYDVFTPEDIGMYPYPSPYGTYDQGGNVSEWNEATDGRWSRGVRGGSFDSWNGADSLMAPFRMGSQPEQGDQHIGFRLVYVPEPTSLVLLSLAGLLTLKKRKNVNSRFYHNCDAVHGNRCRMIVPVLFVVLMAWAVEAQAGIGMETVFVGNPGNAGMWAGEQYGGPSSDAMIGDVDYSYRMGKYEVTAGQYTEFLNAVATTNLYGLYNPRMWLRAEGCKIQRHGAEGDYTYSVASDWANRPVNYVSWCDCARFANWMHNGKGNGDTETGSYTLNGAMIWSDIKKVTREPNATWVLPSEDEWQKSAYHKNDGVTGNFFNYPTSSDIAPSNQLNGEGNNATFSVPGYTVGDPYWRSEVGAHVNSDSPYGTFDQGGNVWEWNESVFFDTYRGFRGASFWSFECDMRASVQTCHNPTYEVNEIGFSSCVRS